MRKVHGVIKCGVEFADGDYERDLRRTWRASEKFRQVNESVEFEACQCAKIRLRTYLVVRNLVDYRHGIVRPVHSQFSGYLRRRFSGRRQDSCGPD